MSDFMQRAQEALTNEGNRWTPEEGAVLAGTLVRIRRIEGQWGNFRVAVIRPLKGGVPVEVAEKTALKEALDEMDKHGPGCQVALKFLGRRQTKSGSGQQYEAYTSYVEPAEAPATNGQQAPAQPEQAAQPEPSPGYPQGGAGNTLATDAVTMTGLAKAALANSDQDELTHIGARARKAGLVWNKTTQRYDDVPVADAVL